MRSRGHDVGALANDFQAVHRIAEVGATQGVETSKNRGLHGVAFLVSDRLKHAGGVTECMDLVDDLARCRPDCRGGIAGDMRRQLRAGNAGQWRLEPVLFQGKGIDGNRLDMLGKLAHEGCQLVFVDDPAACGIDQD